MLRARSPRGDDAAVPVHDLLADSEAMRFLRTRPGREPLEDAEYLVDVPGVDADAIVLYDDRLFSVRSRRRAYTLTRGLSPGFLELQRIL